MFRLNLQSSTIQNQHYILLFNPYFNPLPTKEGIVIEQKIYYKDTRDPSGIILFLLQILTLIN